MKDALVSFLFMLLLMASCSQYTGHNFDPEHEKASILGVLNEQTKAWNEGDIPGFMEGYWKSDSLVFIGSNGINHGWQKTLERYLRSYPSRKEMGNLRFEIQSVDVLNDQKAHLIGKYILTSDLDSLIGTGFFTLLWKKINGKWLIAVDQTCG